MPSERKTRRPAEPMTSECEAALVCAARAQHVTYVIQPAIEEGTLVLLPISDSTLAIKANNFINYTFRPNTKVPNDIC